jgi:hypothetical protein
MDFSSEHINDDISEVHIVFQRHAEACSNVMPVFSSEEDMPPLPELAKLTSGINQQSPTFSKTGNYLPDGLTEYGIAAAREFVEMLTCKQERIENVYMLAASGLTRAIQTLEQTHTICELVGEKHWAANSLGHGRNPSVYCHPGLREATSWPQDFPGWAYKGADGQEVSYIMLKGGSGADDRVATAEKSVNVSNMVWAEGAGNKWAAPEDRLKAVTDPVGPEAAVNGAKEARVWLRNCAISVLHEHRSKGRKGNPRIMVVIHGGNLNFLTKRWYCNFTKASDGVDWNLVSSSTLRHLEACVYTFQSATDEEAELTELEYDSSYEKVLGRYYQHMASNRRLVFKNSDGTNLNQREAHAKWIESIAREIKGVAATRSGLMEAVMGWGGSANTDFLE